MPLLLVHVVLMASKSGVIGLALVGFFLVVRAVLHAQGRMRWLVPVGAAMGLVMALLLGGGRIAERMGAAQQALQRAMRGDATLAASEEGSAMRLMAWACSLDVLRADPLGAGTGDVKNDLVACYEAKGAAPAAARRLNSHSQFLQGGAALGWPGIAAMLALAMVPLALAMRRRSAVLGLFVLLFIVNAAVESVLEVQAGVVLMGLFMGLLANGSAGRAD
jgi:O-antigen ligase